MASPQRDYSISLLCGRRGPALLQLHARLLGHSQPVLAVAIGAGRVVSGGVGGGIRVWDVTSGLCTATLASPTAYALGLHGRGMLVSGGCREACVRVWRLTEGAPKVRGETNVEGDGGAHSATCAVDGRVIARLHRPEGGGGSPCALSVDGVRVVSGDSGVGVPVAWVVDRP